MLIFQKKKKNANTSPSHVSDTFLTNIISDVGNIYVSGHCRAPKDELKQLILSGGGSVANVTRIANVIVGEKKRDEDGADCVTEKWILDSVQFHVVMPFTDYPLNEVEN